MKFLILVHEPDKWATAVAAVVVVVVVTVVVVLVVAGPD
jgi:hypothetical protein